MTLQAFLRICEGYGLKIENDILYNAMSDDYAICGFTTLTDTVYLFTDKGAVEISEEKKLREYLSTKMLDLKKRKLWKKLEKMECDFD